MNGFHRLSDRDFKELKEFIETGLGIRISAGKKTMLESRLHSRIKKLNFKNFREYLNFVFEFDTDGRERFKMIDAITTNKTGFFRESYQFRFLLETVLPGLIAEYGTGIKRPLNAWSAGCSTGEETYSLAISLSEFAEKHRGFKFSILGTDISVGALNGAIRAVYPEERISIIPSNIQKKYFLKSKNRTDRLVRIKPSLRSKIFFKVLNLNDQNYNMRGKMDVVFFRNVIIYFRRSKQTEILSRICNSLTDGGYLFMGHAEALINMKLPLHRAGLNVYRYFPEKRNRV